MAKSWARATTWGAAAGQLLRSGMLLIVVCGVGASAIAAGAKGPLYGKVVYYPKNGNYYELVELPGYKDWGESYKLAQMRMHNGVQGRLAVVNDAYLNDFLKVTFRPFGIVWIGLRYWCRYNKLQWITGQYLEPGDFAAWDTPWASGTTRRAPRANYKPYCGEASTYWPVHYWGVEQSGRWNANGQPKVGTAFFVEYPTGRK